MKYVLLAALLLGCGPKATQELADDPNYVVKFDQASKRLTENFLERGWVVSRGLDGIQDYGDSLLWTGVALGVLSCEDARPILENLLGVIERRDGQLLRFEPQSMLEPGNEISFDGETGFMYGWLMRGLKCPEDYARLQAAWAKRQAYVDAHGGELFPGTGARIPEVFSYTRDLISDFYRTNGNIQKFGLQIMARAATGWIIAAKAAKVSCFRMHLGFLHVRMAEALGKNMSGSEAADMCVASENTDIPALDHWCKRKGIDSYIDAYQENEWVYRHQRCGAWETPDANSNQTPGLDLIFAIKEGYNLDAATPTP